MILTTYNIKGGTGKTSISIQLAKALNLTYISNDKEGGACEVFDDNKSFLVTEDEYTKIPLEKDCIYDLGGFRTNQNIYEIIKGSDFVIVPTLISRGDIKGTIKMLEELHKINQNVLVVINRVKANYKTQNKFEKSQTLINYFKEELKDRDLEFDNLHFTTLREAEVIESGTFDGESVFEIATNRFKKHIYRNILSDLNTILEIIKGGK